MRLLYSVIAPMAYLAAFMAPPTARTQRGTNPLRFFDGLTESDGTLKVVMHKPVHTREIGRGQIKPDGSLSLVQRVEQEGSPPHLRRWLIRQLGPGRFVGTMSEAVGPVTVDEVGGRYRFRFKMKGGMSVEELLTPLPGGRSATTNMTVRKFGITVASSQGEVRKLS